jgi:hypothetical protein
MLWRLEQAGVDIGKRWAELAERSAGHIDDHMMVFADVHYIMALAAGGDQAGSERWLQSSRDYAAGEETEAEVMRTAGLSLGEAALAYRRGDWGKVVERLLPLRPAIRSIGGSHAQRDLFEQMLIDAVLKGGNWKLARALLSERTQARPRNAWGWKHYAKAAAGLGEDEASQKAQDKAKRLLSA